MAGPTLIDGKPPPVRRARRVAVLVFDDVVAADFTAACEVFGRARADDGSPAYETRVCAASRQVRGTWCRIGAPYGLDAVRWADTLVVPGRSPPGGPLADAVGEAIREAAATGARIVSICTGAFVLAELGLLDGRRATTHWAAADELARRYPAVEVDPNVLYVDAGDVLTSAGASAGVDLCLHVVRTDLGSSAAARSARMAVVPLERPGGQAQFVEPSPPAGDVGSLRALLEWIEANPAEVRDVGQLAAHASVTTRTLHRRFVEQTGSTPMQWVLDARTRAAQRLLSETGLPIERVAADTGFGTGCSMRERFRRHVGVSPLAYRRAYRPA